MRADAVAVTLVGIIGFDLPEAEDAPPGLLEIVPTPFALILHVSV